MATEYVVVTEFETPKELEIPPALAPASDDTVEVAELLLDHWYELAFAHEPVKYLTRFFTLVGPSRVLTTLSTALVHSLFG